MSEAQQTSEGQPVRDSTGTLTDVRDVVATPTETTTSAEPSTQTTAPASETGATTTESADGTTVLTKPTETKPDAKAPDTYADFKAPEGYTVDPKAIEAAVPIFKDLGLSQDQAQKLVDFHTKQMIDAAKGPQQAYEALRTEWRDAVTNDPEMKGKLDTIKTDIGRALNSLGDAKLASEFKAAMDLTGAGDHPAFVKAFWKLSQFVTEGTHVTGKGPSPQGQQAPGTGKPSPAAALYPNLS